MTASNNARTLTANQQQPARDYALDAMRGLAVLLMVGFHFVYDLHLFDFINVDFTSPALLLWRYVIVLLFLISVGVSMVISYRDTSFLAYSRRLGKLLGAALLVSIGTYFAFPNNPVLFGILHLIWLASLLGYFFVKRPQVALGVAVGILLLNMALLNTQNIWHADAVYVWMKSYFPAHYGVDYYPPVPWLAWVFMGIFVGYHRVIYQRIFIMRWPLLLFLGRHALVVYLVHQLLLFGFTYTAYWLLNN